MHNTRSAMASLVNRYKAVLKKCHLLNTFGSLALAASLVSGAVGFAHAQDATAADAGATVDYTPTLYTGIYDKLIAGQLDTLGTTWETYIKGTGAYDSWGDYTDDVKSLFTGLETTPAYGVTPGVTLGSSDYYTTFTVYSIVSSTDLETPSAYTIEKTNYGVLLDDTEKTIQDIITAYLTSQKPTLDSATSAYTGITTSTTDSDLYTGTFGSITYYVEKNTSASSSQTRDTYEADTNGITSNISGYTSPDSTTGTNTTDFTLSNISKNFTNLSSSAAQSTQWIHYNGGAIYIYNENDDVTVSLDSIEGDFIGNSISSDYLNIYQGNGGAIALFATNDKNVDGDGSITISKITGDFIGNSASRAGGAIYLFSNYEATVEIKAIEGNFIGNAAKAGSGGAIANYEGIVGSVEGNFIGNTAYEYGGAIANYIRSSNSNRASTITSVVGDFVANTAVDGGAIANYVYTYTDDAKASASTIGEIIGNFIGNTASGDGGAIYNFAHGDTSDGTTASTYVTNTAVISTITGDFIGNSAGGSGGAIYNDDNHDSTALIGIITGDFICNTAGVYGGAIYNTSQINTINGNFIKNSVGDNTSTDVSIGGAIYNMANGEAASIGDIEGSFIGNSAASLTGVGGAIANYSAVAGATATIGNIIGDFIANWATKYGGAIYNDSNNLTDVKIGNIYGNFLYNYVEGDTGSTSGSIKGGAIYNNDTIGIIYGSFIGNYVVGTKSNTVAGGAVYTTADMEFCADGTTNYFSDNYIAYYDSDRKIDSSTIDYNAIYVDIDNITDSALTSDITLTFTMTGDGNFVVNDSISGNSEYTPLDVIGYTSGSVDFNADSGNDYKLVISDGSGAELASLTADFSSSTTTTSVVTVVGSGGNVLGTETTVTVDSDTPVVTTTGSGSTVGDGETSSTTTTTVVTNTYKDNSLGTSSYTVTTVVEGEGADKITTTTTTAKIVSSNSSGGTTTVSYTNVVVDYADTSKDTETSTDVSVAATSTTVPMTGITAYDINIVGDKDGDNTFYLNDMIDNFGEFSITNATLYLSAYEHDNGKTTGGLYALDSYSSVTFGEGSQLTIDMSAFPDSMSYDETIKEIAVLQGNGASLIINNGTDADGNTVTASTLKLDKVTTGRTFTILSGFVAYEYEHTYDEDSGNVTSTNKGVSIQGNSEDGYAAWVVDNVSTVSDLQDITIVRDGYNDLYDGTEIDDPTTYDETTPVYYVISVSAATESPLYDTTVGEIVYYAAHDDGFGYDSDIAGERYYYDISTIPDDKEEVAVAEGTAGLDKVAGVPTVTYRVNRLSSDALSSRLSNMGDTDSVLASYVVNASGDVGATGDSGSADASAHTGDDAGLGRLSKKYESVALWFVPMYGHDRTSGASIAGYDADFVTNIYGGVVGVDKTIADGGANALGADLYRVGVAVNMGVGDASASGDFDGVENDFNFGGVFVYGVAEYGNLTLSVDAGFSKIISEVDQDLSAYGFAGTKADVHSSAWSIDAHGEYRVETSVVDIVPYAGVELVSMKTEDYAVKRDDDAGGTVYNISSDRQNIVSVPVGVKFDTQWKSNGWTVTPQLSVGAIFAMGDLDEHSLITMPGVDGSGRTHIQVVDEVTFDVSAGVAVMKGNWCLGLDYELQRSEHRTGHALVGLIQYRF